MNADLLAEFNDRINKLEMSVFTTKSGMSGGTGAAIGSWGDMVDQYGDGFWGIISDTFAEFKNAITDTIAWAWTEFVNFAWDTFFGKLTGGLSAITSAGIIAVNAISDLAMIAANLFTATAGAWGKFVDGFWTGATALAKFAADFFSWDKIAGTFSSFKSAITDTISWLWSEVSKTFTDICNTLGSWANMVGTTLGKLALDSTTIFMNTLNSSFLALSSFATGFWTATTAAWGKFVDGFWSGATALAKFAADFFSWDKIAGTFNSFKSAITDAIAWAWSEFVDFTWNTFFGKISSGLSAITSAGVIAVNAISDLAMIASGLFTATAGAWGKFVDGFWTGATALAKFANDFFSWNKIAGTFASFKSAITDTISWAWSEISKTFTDICNTLGSWANMVGTTLGKLALSSTAIFTGVLDATFLALSSFVSNFFTADASGRGKFQSGWLIDSLVDSVSGITGGKIWIGTAKWLSNMIFGYGGGSPKLNFDELSVEPYKLPTSAYNYVVNGSFENGTWGGAETQNTSYYYFGKYSARIYTTGSSASGGYSNWIDLRGIDTLSLSCWIRVLTWASGDGYFYMNFYVYDSAKTYIKHTDWYTRSSTCSWTQAKTTYDRGDSAFPSNTAFARVSFGLHMGTPDSSTRTAYFDGYQMNFGDQIPAFQDFTTYSFNWMPQKIETTASSEQSWSSTSWTDVLTLNFECESTMLIILIIYGDVVIQSNNGSGIRFGNFRCNLDNTEINYTEQGVGGECAYLEQHSGVYSCHTVLTVAKGSHHIDLQMKAYTTDATVFMYDRRLSILKGHYEGGTS